MDLPTTPDPKFTPAQTNVRGKTLIHRAGCTTLPHMNATTFKQRLTLGKRRLREMKAAGQPLELTRPWSLKSMKELSKALEGGPPVWKSAASRLRTSAK